MVCEFGCQAQEPSCCSYFLPQGKQTCAGQHLKGLLGWLECTNLLSLGMLHRPKGDLREKAAWGTPAMPMWLAHSSSFSLA